MCPADSDGRGARGPSGRRVFAVSLPQPDTRSIRAAAVSRDRQRAGFRVALVSHRVEPAADGGDGKLSRVACDSDTHPPCIGANVVRAIRHDLAEFLVLEVVHLHPPRIAFGAIVGAAGLVLISP
jgi:hypothetical protein